MRAPSRRARAQFAGDDFVLIQHKLGSTPEQIDVHFVLIQHKVRRGTGRAGQNLVLIQHKAPRPVVCEGERLC
jgi:hypothetical protein